MLPGTPDVGELSQTVPVLSTSVLGSVALQVTTLYPVPSDYMLCVAVYLTQ